MLSHDMTFLTWIGHEMTVSRPNSTHPRVFCMSLSDFSTTCVSDAGDLVISSGFFSGSNELWFTVQSGVEVSRTIRVECSTFVEKCENGPAIVGNSATLKFFKTESLTAYPSISNAMTETCIDLPVSLPALALTTKVWKHGMRKYLEGVIYSVRTPESGMRPLILHLHGGPAMAVPPFRKTLLESTDWFLPLVMKGFDILSITYSGSFGFGDEFAQASIGTQGKTDLADVDAVIDVFGSRVNGIMGGSYGGFLCMHAFSTWKFPFVPKFIALYPYISSRNCAAETGDFLWESEYCGVDGLNIFPVPNACMQPDVVPHLYTANVELPLLLFHGDADDVCPISQSKQIFHILRQRGSTMVSLVTYLGEGHGFKQPANRKDCIDRIIKFLSVPNAVTSGVSN